MSTAAAERDTPTSNADAVHRALSELAPQLGEGARGITDLELMSGGASKETWSFRLDGPGTRLILRRLPDWASGESTHGVTLAGEAELIRRADGLGVPVPKILAMLEPRHRAGEGIVMTAVEGETLPRRIHRDPRYDPARAAFAGQAGAILSSLHNSDPAGLPLKTLDPAAKLAFIVARHRRFGIVRPVFELAIRWLSERIPDSGPPRFLHGDFRMGNLMLGHEGIRAVLDWEGAHAGDPHEDLGWLAMMSWRFGATLPVGGMCTREALWAAYEAAGGRSVDEAAARWWETLSALHWGVIIEDMHSWVVSGADTSLERHVIARRASETEYALLVDLTGRWS